MIKILNKKNVNIICPKNRVDNYLAYCGHVFEVKKVKFFDKIDLLEDYTDILFFDQKNLVNDKLSLLFKKKINLIIILLWNSDRDYSTYKNKISLLEKRFNVQLVSVSNFSRKIYFPLNRFTVKSKSSLKSISGVSFLKRVKFNFPLIYGLYNFLKYFNEAKIFFECEKLVFVGIGNKKDAIHQLSWIKKKKYTKKINKICDIIIKGIKNLSYVEFNEEFYKIFNSKTFQNLPISIKYFLTQISIRYLILSHLKNFNNFYHKNNSSYPLDLLRTNIYKKVFHLELGSQSGNARAQVRQIYLQKFFKKRFFEINIFKNNEDYSKRNIFKKRFNQFHNKIIKFHEYKNFSADLSEILINIKKIKNV